MLAAARCFARGGGSWSSSLRRSGGGGAARSPLSSMMMAAARPAIIVSTTTTFGSLDVPAAVNAGFNNNHWAALLAGIASVIGLTALADRHKKTECCGIAGVVGNPKMHSDARYVRLDRRYRIDYWTACIGFSDQSMHWKAHLIF
jgi:hypothetical protein